MTIIYTTAVDDVSTMYEEVHMWLVQCPSSQEEEGQQQEDDTSPLYPEVTHWLLRCDPVVGEEYAVSNEEEVVQHKVEEEEEEVVATKEEFPSSKKDDSVDSFPVVDGEEPSLYPEVAQWLLGSETRSGGRGGSSSSSSLYPEVEQWLQLTPHADHEIGDPTTMYAEVKEWLVSTEEGGRSHEQDSLLVVGEKEEEQQSQKEVRAMYAEVQKWLMGDNCRHSSDEVVTDAVQELEEAQQTLPVTTTKIVERSLIEEEYVSPIEPVVTSSTSTVCGRSLLVGAFPDGGIGEGQVVIPEFVGDIATLDALGDSSSSDGNDYAGESPLYREVQRWLTASADPVVDKSSAHPEVEQQSVLHVKEGRGISSLYSEVGKWLATSPDHWGVYPEVRDWLIRDGGSSNVSTDGKSAGILVEKPTSSGLLSISGKSLFVGVLPMVEVNTEEGTAETAPASEASAEEEAAAVEASTGKGEGPCKEPEVMAAAVGSNCHEVTRDSPVLLRSIAIGTF